MQTIREQEAFLYIFKTIIRNNDFKPTPTFAISYGFADSLGLQLSAKAQTNAQMLYAFGSYRKFVTLTLEMFKQDKWGSTYYFVDHDFNYDKMVVGEKNIAQGGTYTEISRALNFWQ